MMRLLVRVQVRLLVEPLVAAGVRTAKRFFTSMNSQVSFQIEIETKFFAADFTFIWFLPSVHEHMPF